MSTHNGIAEIAARLTAGPEAYIVSTPTSADHEGPFPYIAEFELAPRASEQLSDGAFQARRAETWPEYSDTELDVPIRVYRPLARLALLDPPTRVVAALTAQLLNPRATGRQHTAEGSPDRAERAIGEHPDYAARAFVDFSADGAPTGPVEVLTGSRDIRRQLPLARSRILDTIAFGLNVVTFRELAAVEREDIAEGAAPLINLLQSPSRG